MPLNLLAVFLGGVLGTALRLGAHALMPSGPLDFATLAVNVAGSFALAVLVSHAWGTARGWLRAGLGAGLLGSFTTFSAVSVTVVQLTASNDLGTAGLYLLVTLLLSIAAASLGLRLGRAARIQHADEVAE